MPTFNQAAFISNAITSLLNQQFKNWELLIINDGCTDETERIVKTFNHNKKIRYIKNSVNEGLGVCMNIGLNASRFDLITYLPSDDIVFPTHLGSMFKIINEFPDAILVFSGIKQIRHSLTGTSESDIKSTKDGNLQLAQVLHRKTKERWVERSEFVTDDYFKMYWKKLLGAGQFIPTHAITCQITDHPEQRHIKISRDLGGGLNTYRSFYGVTRPIRLQYKNEGILDETIIYRNYREKHEKAKDGLRILIVGELSYNPERIYALEEAGHELFGLWVKDPWWFTTAGPLPFGNIKDIPYDNWRKEVSKIKPDIIYALLNTVVIPFAAEVRKEFQEIPFIWHFKEGPFYCRQKGWWNQFHYLQTRSDGIIYLNDDIRKYYNICFPLGKDIDYMILDGDLPKKDRFKTKRSKRLSEETGGFHTVVPGRPFGISPADIKAMADGDIHFHFYGENWHGGNAHFVKQSKQVAPDHIHLHPFCDPENWTEELSRYDAGWLHNFESKNYGDILRCCWEDLNLPARMTTLISAGLPLLQHDNCGHIVATQSICKDFDIGIFFKRFEDLPEVFDNKEQIAQVRTNVWNKRMKFSFDNHVPELIRFFKRVIEKKASGK